MHDLKPYLAQIAEGKTLSENEAAAAFNIIMSGDATASQIGAMLMGMRMRGETVEEITGAARTMREKALQVSAPENAVDVVGTGGDSTGTYNISTGAAFVVAAHGVPVAKHGNRAQTSKSGSADVLSALGINLDADMKLVEQAIHDANIGFLMATRHHSAMRYVGPARKELGTRTIFNLLGPLSNPAGVKRMVIGVFSKDWLIPLAEVLGKLGAEHVWVVHGHSGLDEISTTGPTEVAEYKDGLVTTFTITPEDVGLERVSIEDLRGGSPEENADALLKVMTNDVPDNLTAFRDVIAMNAGAVLYVAGAVDSLKDGVSSALNKLKDGSALKAVSELKRITNGSVE
jgi:anthranilate phosphoribosyltransferase